MFGNANVRQHFHVFSCLQRRGYQRNYEIYVYAAAQPRVVRGFVGRLLLVSIWHMYAHTSPGKFSSSDQVFCRFDGFRQGSTCRSAQRVGSHRSRKIALVCMKFMLDDGTSSEKTRCTRENEMPIARVSLNPLGWINVRVESEPRHRNVRTRTRLDAQIARGTADSYHRHRRRRRRKALSFPASSFVLVELRRPVWSGAARRGKAASPTFSSLSAQWSGAITDTARRFASLLFHP